MHVFASWQEVHGCALGSAARHRSSRIRHDVMQRLVHPALDSGGPTRGYRLEALALDGQHQVLGVVFDGNHAIRMPGGLFQTIQIGLQSFCLARESGNWRLFALEVPPNGRSQLNK